MKTKISLILFFTSVFCFSQTEKFKAYYEHAKLGNYEAQYNVAVCYFKGIEGVNVDFDKSFYWCKKSVEGDFYMAQWLLGFMYRDGSGCLENKKQAVYWFTKSAKQGYAKAQHDLGIAYNNGEGVLMDKRKAVYWYKKAASQGYAKSQFNLAKKYFYGQGVEINKKKSVYWLKEAYKNGDKDAKNFWEQNNMWIYDE